MDICIRKFGGECYIYELLEKENKYNPSLTRVLDYQGSSKGTSMHDVGLSYIPEVNPINNIKNYNKLIFDFTKYKINIKYYKKNKNNNKINFDDDWNSKVHLRNTVNLRDKIATKKISYFDLSQIEFFVEV